MNTNKEPISSKHSLPFIREVARYFMDFLETDFHKRRNPKRSIRLRNENNLLVGLDLSKYPTFSVLVWKSINRSFDNSVLNNIQKGSYRTNIPDTLLSLLKTQIERLAPQQLDDVLQKISGKLQEVVDKHRKDYDSAVQAALENAQEVIREELVLPLVSSLEKPLANLHLADDYSLRLMEEELSSVLLNTLQSRISELVRLQIVGETTDCTEQLASVLTIQDTRGHIAEFFESYRVVDLFAEVYEMDRNRSILDKHEFYLYFFDISFRQVKFPIFYIPLSLERDGDLFNVEFDSQVYMNKKALEYIVQEYNSEKGTKGNPKIISDRIIYLAQHKGALGRLFGDVVNELVNFFGLDSKINMSDPRLQIARNPLIRVSNSCYVSLFEMSDEALVNDYEEILHLLSIESSEIAEAFARLVDDFIHKDPESFNERVEDDWDGKDTSDKLVFPSPIPLNSEQRQILSALSKDGCTYITVEGPPGTGKSHTITAILFNAILNNESVLVLSDKKEALDVVEDKITETMNKVRLDRQFQNPILRLGRTGSTYSQILSTASIQNIRTHYRAVKKEYEALESNIEGALNTLEEDLEAQILTYEDIDIADIDELLRLESYYEEHGCPIDIEEAIQQADSAAMLEDSRKLFLTLKSQLSDDTRNEQVSRLFALLGISMAYFKDLNDFLRFVSLLEVLCSNVQELRRFSSDVPLLNSFAVFTDRDLTVLEQLVREYDRARTWIFGYFLKSSKVQRLDSRFAESFPYSRIEYPHRHLEQLRDVVRFMHYAVELKVRVPPHCHYGIDYLGAIHGLVRDDSLVNLCQEMVGLREDLGHFQHNASKHPTTLKKLRVNLSRFTTLMDNYFTKMLDDDFTRLVRYVSLYQRVATDFAKIPQVDYMAQKENIQRLVTTQMTYLMDKRLIGFSENNRATARTLRDIIRSKNRFPKDEFAKLKEAFPCILAGIRDYAEYVPLEPRAFDYVIIDEASQVSIAQAFPALLRAKKVVIFGDKKQFSNVKAALARTDTNKEYLNRLEASFRTHVSEEPAKLVKLGRFNIKTSVLEFFEFVGNYNTQLLKHFRGYKELISYSNRNFYSDSLQVMKIRGKPISEVLKISIMDNDVKEELIPNANVKEADFIFSQLQELKQNGSNASVGIITPHTNQQKLIVEKLNKIADKDHYLDTFKLKIMTFDTCQGEERDIVFYSMVATTQHDRLWGIFIKDLGDVDIEEDGRIRVQRLNVGFSRVKECMHLVLSKPLDEYEGSIGTALRHYAYALDEAKREKDVATVDSKSKMEPLVLTWFYQTQFWQENKDNVEFIPQFEIGKYLRQLDRTYEHPNYVVDFLLVYRDATGKEHKIVIEYDGFREHFSSANGLDAGYRQYYYNDEDVYREKVLESYGYKFLRINKFNAGRNPIATLDERIGQLVGGVSITNSLLTSIHEIAEGIRSGDVKECPRCKELRSLDSFRDVTLISRYGRICNQCKESSRAIRRTVAPARGSAFRDMRKDSRTTCPSCGSRMILRNGRYGRFYGCARYPYCRGTRPS